MAAWGLIVAVLLVVGTLPFFLGLAVVIPVLGHATWHLYRETIEPELNLQPLHPARRARASPRRISRPTVPLAAQGTHGLHESRDQTAGRLSTGGLSIHAAAQRCLELDVNAMARSVTGARRNGSLVLAAVAPNIRCGFDTNVDERVDFGANDIMTSRFSVRALALGALLLTSAAPALAAPCGTGTFEAWLEDFKKEAAAKGISQSAIQAGLTGVTLDKAVHCARPFAEGFQPEL